MTKKYSKTNFVISFFIVIFVLFCVLPMILTFMVSITDENMIKQNGYQFFPEKFSFYAYKLIFTSDSSVINGYKISILITLIGTVLAVTITTMAAYLLANKNVKYRTHLSLFFFITMVFNSGLVPWYMMCKNVGLYDNFLALVIPTLVFSPFNLFLVRNFMNSIPNEIRESAIIDGANDATIAFKMYVPLCVPVIATISLFYGLDYWNSWFNAIMLVDNPDMRPIQYILMQIKSQMRMIQELQKAFGQNVSGVTLPTESIKMATAVITVGPIIFMYPYLQKYFVKGLIVGSVKG